MASGSGGEDLADVVDRITAGLRELAPPGWQRLEASFALTVVTESALFVVDDGHGPVRLPASVLVVRRKVVHVREDEGPERTIIRYLG